MQDSTRLIQFDCCPDDPHAPTSTPIYQTATFAQADPLEFGNYDYSRSGNPTRTVLEQQLAQLDRGSHAFAFASGIAAIDTVLRLVQSGGRIVASLDLYGGTWRLLDSIVSSIGVEVVAVDANDFSAVERAVGKGDLMILETPGNPLLGVFDLARLSKICKKQGGMLAVDSTLMTPLLQKPLDLGADIVIHSATKGLSGHSDLCAGVVVVNNDELASKIGFLQNAVGNALAPFESWLLLRGMKTLSLRLKQQQSSAIAAAELLSKSQCVEQIYFPGLESHPHHHVHSAQALGPGCLISIKLGTQQRAKQFVDALALFTTAVSFGGVGSVASIPVKMSHASVCDSRRPSLDLSDDLVRLSFGIEDTHDLLADLTQACSVLTCNPTIQNLS